MTYLFLVTFLVICGYLLYKERTGAMLCLLTLFPEVVGIMLNKVGLMGFNMAAKYAIFACVLWSSRKLIDYNWVNLWNNILTVLLFVLIGVLIWHNEVFIGGARTNPEIAAFQLNVILRIIIPYIILIVCADQYDVIEDYCKAIPWWGLFFILAFVSIMGFGAVNFSDRMTLEKETGINSISLSRYAAMTILGSLICVMREKSGSKNAYIIILITGVFMLLLASQRGTIIGVGAAALLALGLILLRQGKIKQFAGIAIGILATIFVLTNYFNFEILNRFQQLEGYRSFERYADYGIAWRAFQENNYLTGLGSMGYHAYTGGFRPYPHSMVLELMSEYGIAGLVFAVTSIVYGGWMSYKILTRTNATDYEMAIPIIWIALLFSVLVSGSFLSNSPFFLVTGMLILCYQNPKEEDCEQEYETEQE